MGQTKQEFIVDTSQQAAKFLSVQLLQFEKDILTFAAQETGQDPRKLAHDLLLNGLDAVMWELGYVITDPRVTREIEALKKSGIELEKK